MTRRKLPAPDRRSKRVVGMVTSRQAEDLAVIALDMNMTLSTVVRDCVMLAMPTMRARAAARRKEMEALKTNPAR